MDWAYAEIMQGMSNDSNPEQLEEAQNKDATIQIDVRCPYDHDLLSKDPPLPHPRFCHLPSTIDESSAF